jgi:hypothetical protein
MGDKCLARRIRVRLDQSECAGGHTAPLDSGGNRLRHDLAGARVARMALHNHRATGGEGRSGVAPGRGKRQREIRRTENAHWPDGALDHAQVGARCRGSVRKCLVMTPV